MKSEQRTATLWGFLFPLLTLGGIVGVLGLSGRGTAPSTGAGGTQTSTAQTGTAQNSTPMSGTGSGPMPGTSPTTAQSAPAAAPSGTAPAPQAPATQAPVAQAPAANAAGAAPAAQATAPAAQGTPVQASANGAQVYTTSCVSCHGEQGAGVAGAFPALAGNKAVLGDDKYLSNVLLYGLQGQINVNGQVYNGVMPAWAASLTDAEIAAVITHIRVSWGNNASAVSEAAVKTERGTPKTVAQVLAQRPQ